MKNIQEVLEKRKSAGRGAPQKEIDEKTIARIFLEAAKGEIKNFEDADVREIHLKYKTLYIKTAHPVISSELFLRREKIIEELNKMAGKMVVERIVI